ncbi:MAG TPA: ATP-binding protein [Acidimicrobiales bacterium]|nr:ATP-binding protein [Acidimicrobiales bacterium]
MSEATSAPGGDGAQQAWGVQAAPDLAGLLSGMPMFELLDPAQLDWLVGHAQVRRLPAGAVLMQEGHEGSGFWFLVDGEIELRRDIGGADVRVGGSRERGAWAGVIPYATVTSRLTGVLTVDSTVVHLSDGAMTEMLERGFPIARHLLAGLSSGTERFGQRIAERERLAALGRLSAGLAHELNNPAAATGRAVARAGEVVADVEATTARLTTAARDAGRPAPDLVALAATIERRREQRAPVSGLARADLEDGLADELSAFGHPDPEGGAAVLLDAGLDAACLEELVRDAAGDDAVRTAVVGWAVARAELTTLLDEAATAATRISEIVAKVKEYSYRDRAPDAEVDVRRGLDDTLAMLKGELEGVHVERAYEEVPLVVGSGGELNQVWTNLIENAADALAPVPNARLTVRVGPGEQRVVVEVEDNGPGIPDDVVDRIFEPFFTTKPPGAGTGLGLDLARRIVEAHKGELRVESEPGRTVFTVVLPAAG